MKIKTMIAAAVLAAVLGMSAWAQQPAPAPTPEPAEELAMRVELKVSMEGRTAQAATNAAVRQAKDQAIKDYIESAVPEKLLLDKGGEVKAILAERDHYVISYEVSDSKVEGQWLMLSFWVKLNQKSLDAALKRANLTPARGMPRTFVAVMGTMGGRPLASGWDQAAGGELQLNPCERDIAREFESYGFEVVRPAAGGPSIIASQVVSPEGPEEKARMFRELRDKFQAGVLVIGLMSSEHTAGATRPETYDVTLKVASCDVASEKVTFSDQTSGSFTLLAPRDTDKVYSDLCAEAAQSLVQAAFKDLTPAFAPGEKRDLTVTVSGLSSFFQMREVERKLRDESPGAENVTLTRMSQGEIELVVTTTADAQTLANWLSTNIFEGVAVTAEVEDETHVVATAKTTAMPPIPPGMAPPGEAPVPAAGDTAESKTAPAPPE